MTCGEITLRLVYNYIGFIFGFFYRLERSNATSGSIIL